MKQSRRSNPRSERADIETRYKPQSRSRIPAEAIHDPKERILKRRQWVTIRRLGYEAIHDPKERILKQWPNVRPHWSVNRSNPRSERADIETFTVAADSVNVFRSNPRSERADIETTNTATSTMLPPPEAIHDPKERILKRLRRSITSSFTG